MYLPSPYQKITSEEEVPFCKNRNFEGKKVTFKAGVFITPDVGGIWEVVKVVANVVTTFKKDTKEFGIEGNPIMYEQTFYLLDCKRIANDYTELAIGTTLSRFEELRCRIVDRNTLTKKLTKMKRDHRLREEKVQATIDYLFNKRSD